MTDPRSIEPSKYNAALAEALKKDEKFEKPAWIDFVKSGTHRQRPISEPDFWYKRAASILRQFYLRGIVGIGRLRSRYGGRKDMGMAPPRFRKGSGKIARFIVQQAEAAGFLEKVKAKRSGRQLTAQGRAFLEKVAA